MMVQYSVVYEPERNDDNAIYYIIVVTNTTQNAVTLANEVCRLHNLEIGYHVVSVNMLFKAVQDRHGYYERQEFTGASYLKSVSGDFVELNVRELKLRTNGLLE